MFGFAKKQQQKNEFHYSSMSWSTASKFKQKVYKISLKDANAKNFEFYWSYFGKEKRLIDF